MPDPSQQPDESMSRFDADLFLSQDRAPFPHAAGTRRPLGYREPTAEDSESEKPSLDLCSKPREFRLIRHNAIPNQLIEPDRQRH